MDSFEIPLNGAKPDDIAGIFATVPGNYDLLKHAIEREFKPHGSPDVITMAFDRIKYNRESGEGSFRVLLDINFTYGCEDVLTEKKGQTSEWTFKVENDKVIFYSSPFAESRSTADEF